MSSNSPARYFEKARYQVSAAKLGQCPPDEGREVAFAGRSNAGKSSALNTLTRNSKLARTSKTPGRTRLFNFFELDAQRRLVDLPGYGYAKVPPAMKAQWERQIDQYLRRRTSLAGLILVMDIRHPLSAFDRMMIDWGAACTMPIHVLLTKSDKLKKGGRVQQYHAVKKELAVHPGVTVQMFSSLDGDGVDTLALKLMEWLQTDER